MHRLNHELLATFPTEQIPILQEVLRLSVTYEFSQLQIASHVESVQRLRQTEVYRT